MSPPRGFRYTGTRLPGQTRRLPQALVPLQSFAREPYAPLATHTLSQGFSPPQRYPSIMSHHSWVLPSQVKVRPCAYHALRRFYPMINSPVLFQPGTLTGFWLFRALPDGNRRYLSTRLPLLRLAYQAASSRLFSLLRTAPPRNWLPAKATHRTDLFPSVPPGSRVFPALTTHEASLP